MLNYANLIFKYKYTLVAISWLITYIIFHIFFLCDKHFERVISITLNCEYVTIDNRSLKN